MGTTVKMLAVAACIAFAASVCAEQGQTGIEIESVAHGTSTPLRAHAPMLPGWRPGVRPYVIHYPKGVGAYAKNGSHGGNTGGSTGGSWSDQDLQQTSYPAAYRPTGSSTVNNFEGQDFTGAIPPDPTLAVGGPSGSTQIVQLVNTSYAVFDTSGNMLTSGDLALSLFSAMPNSNCYLNGDGGDPTVVWDQIDKKWIISQLAYDAYLTQFDFCVAISQNADATGIYDVYDFSFGGTLPDYPKLAVWSDGIYFSANMFNISVNLHTGLVRSTFLGAEACKFPLPGNGSNPSSITFSCSGGNNTAIYNILPANLDGYTPPANAGGPNPSDYYLQFVDNLSTTSGNELMLYQWQNGSLVALNPLPVNTFHEACGGGTCIPQLNTTQQLDSIGDRLMYRLSYRNYNGLQSMVVTHSVQINSASNQTGIRWYQLCSQQASGNLPVGVCQESTFSPDTSTYRWMGSIAQDSAGDLGLGFSESSSSMYPNIAVTGLENGADSGMEDETLLLPPGTNNFQDTYSRWGDYSTMAIDPNGCTFWYTAEYNTPLNVFGAFNFFWGTRIASFQFPNCTPVTP